MSVRAFIFDLDGVVVDSNDLHVKSWQEVARRHGFECHRPEYIGKCGLRTSAVIQDLLRWPVSPAEAERIGGEKESLYRQWIREQGIAPIRGVIAFLEAARRQNILCAIGSSAPRENVDLCLEVLQLTGWFAGTVSGGDVRRGKPAPDIFLAAAGVINVSAEDCVVFEDSPAGVAAARAAGMEVVALTTSHRAEELAGATVITRDFTALSVAQVRRLGETSLRKISTQPLK